MRMWLAPVETKTVIGASDDLAAMGDEERVGEELGRQYAARRRGVGERQQVAEVDREERAVAARLVEAESDRSAHDGPDEARVALELEFG
jgi:hypothetical protein